MKQETLPQPTCSIERSNGLISNITYPDGSTAEFKYERNQLVSARVGDYYNKRYRANWIARIYDSIRACLDKSHCSDNSDVWVETLNGFGGDNPVNGIANSVVLVQVDTARFPAGTLIKRGGHYFSVISPNGPLHSYFIGINEDGTVRSISYPNKTTVLLEYGEDRELTTVNGPAQCFSFDSDKSGKIVVASVDCLGRRIGRLTLDKDVDSNIGFDFGEATDLYVIADPQSIGFGTIVAEGVCPKENQTVRAVYKPDGRSCLVWRKDEMVVKSEITQADGQVQAYPGMSDEPVNDGLTDTVAAMSDWFPADPRKV